MLVLLIKLSYAAAAARTQQDMLTSLFLFYLLLNRHAWRLACSSQTISGISISWESRVHKGSQKNFQSSSATAILLMKGNKI